MSKLDKIMVMNTGGTIGMINSEPGNILSPLAPAEEWSEIAANHPILKPNTLGVDMDYYQFDPLLDSSDMRHENWQQMADVIGQHYNEYTGFVILHGTDTLCYTATALSFMLENLNKPVILTGSQLPMVRPRSDAAQNLVTSIQIAAHHTFGGPKIPEVCIFFRDELLRGNRSRKLSSSGYAGFKSPNYPPLAVAGEHIRFNEQAIHRRKGDSAEFFANTFLDMQVMVLEIFPGFNPKILRNIFEPRPSEARPKALVLKTFGTGNAPGNKDFLSAIEFVSNQGVIIVDVTQCPEGTVELGLYEASSGLLNRGVISGTDLTPEAAVCKLMYLLGKGWPTEEVKRVMQLDLNGEQSLNIYNIFNQNTGTANPVFETNAVVPGDVDLHQFTGASMRFQDAQLTEADSPTFLELKIFFNHPTADEKTPTTDPHFVGTISKRIESKDPTDLFCDVASATRRLVKPGQILTIRVVNHSPGQINWEKMSLSIYTRVQS